MSQHEQNVSGLRPRNKTTSDNEAERRAGIEPTFDLTSSTLHQLIIDGSILTGSDTQVALARRALMDIDC
ncbi:MAG TPA: hypothetical protein VFI73_03290 [Candidatus Nitrosopolaris sp.]|nr:hypothetical protein [Candidatus Nitrosopolaris sp.]